MSTNLTVPEAALRDFDSFSKGQAILGSRASIPFVFNTTSMTAQSDALDIYGILGGTVTNHANVILVPVPSGSSYLKLCHEWVGTTPTSGPIVRVFGRLKAEVGFPVTTLPESVHASYHSPTQGESPSGMWVPRANDASGTYALTLSSTIAQKCAAASLRGEPSILHVGGTTHIAVAVSTAAAGPTRGLVFGWFEG